MREIGRPMLHGILASDIRARLKISGTKEDVSGEEKQIS